MTNLNIPSDCDRSDLSGDVKIEIGRFTYGFDKSNIISYEPGLIKIGRFCSIAKSVKYMIGGQHELNSFTTYPLINGIIKLDSTCEPDYDVPSGLVNQHCLSKIENRKPDISIGHDVWLGYGCFISSGITIGNGAVIASNAHIVKDVQPYEIVGGNPGKVIKMRHSEDVIKYLIDLEWWNWPISKIERNSKLLQKFKFTDFRI